MSTILSKAMKALGVGKAAATVEEGESENTASTPVGASYAAAGITAYSLIPSNRFKIRKARRDRQWMDVSRDRFAYRCLPLVIANQLGWEIICPSDFTAVWDGGPYPNAVSLTFHTEPDAGILAHFGEGVVTFNIGYLFRTPPGIGLLCMGPANEPKPGITPLEGYVESDWSNYSFTMNWKFSAPGEVRFLKNEVICRIVPYDLALVESLEPVLKNMDQMPADELAEHNAWVLGRSAFQEKLMAHDPATVKKAWQRDYMVGRRFDQPAAKVEHQHRTKLNHTDFKSKKRQAPFASNRSHLRRQR